MGKNKTMGKSKTKSILSLVALVLAIGVLAYTAAFGLQLGDWLFPSVFDPKYGVKQGLDLVGGSSITYEAQVEDDMSAEDLAKNMDVVVSMLRQRLDNEGYSEATIVKSGDRRVTVEIPSVSDPEEAVQHIGSTAKVEFKDGDGNVIMDGDMIDGAQYAYGPVTENGANVHHVVLHLTDEGAEIFQQTTEKYLNVTDKNYISILMDDQVLSQPYFSKVISGNDIVIEGNFDEESATRLANLIAGGSLPFDLKEVELRSVGPTLGEQSLQTCLYAGAIGVLLVMLFMILFYRLPGIITSVILLGYIAVVGLILSTFKINLSLPGIAGIVLSIGMAVDANVIIFERIKEELKVGKSLKGSVQAGFGHALSAILDSNITTIIASVVLYIFGTGSIRGFAVTLFIGIVVSMFCAVVVCRFVMNQMPVLGLVKPSLYGIKKLEVE